MMVHFSRKEFECDCGCGFDTVDFELAEVLDDVAHYWPHSRVLINSGCRCPQHNSDIGGEPLSQHLKGKAADIVVENIHADKVATYLELKYHDKYGIGRYDGRTHIDVRSIKTRWDKR